MHPLQLEGAKKDQMRTQLAALCYRRKGKNMEVLLITSRGTGRWILPRGWPMDGLTPCQAAKQEAWEEAGVKGHAYNSVIGLYSYIKVLKDGSRVPCMVSVFPLEVKSLVDDFPEAGQRKRKWFSPKKAAARVGEIELRQIIRDFDPARLR